MPTNDTYYSYHIKLIELVNSIIWVHILLLLINSLGGEHTCTHIHTHTHTHTNTHTNFTDRRNFKKPSVH